MAQDPVCGMRVDEARAPASSQYQGRTIHFCSQGCKIAFDQNPSRWQSALDESAKGSPVPVQEARDVLSGDGVVIRASNLKKTYQRGNELVEALRDLDLEIVRGEFVTVMGPSGGGKSTLLHLIGGIDHPSSGEIWVNGTEVSAASEEALTHFRREKIGFVFQFYNLLPTLTAAENVELPLIALSYPKKGRRVMAEEILNVVGLGDRLTHKPAELSGGEQQRVAIARAIVANPSIVLADEVTGDLDSTSSEKVLSLMEDINRKLGLTFLIVTHNPAMGERGRRRLFLKDGRIVGDEGDGR